MKHLIFICIFCFLCCLSLSAQGEYNKCYFGTGGLDFNGTYPSALNDSQMQGRESPASICNARGTLLFYTNGGESPTVPGVKGGVWNAKHNIMENGILDDSTGCISSFQGAIAFPANIHNQDDGIYYIFMRDCIESSVSGNNFNAGLTYCVIDMNKNAGLGKVISKKNPAVPHETADAGLKTDHEPVSAVLHENNIDWWVFSYTKGAIYSLKLTPNGLEEYTTFDIAEGQIVVSPRRDKLLAGNALFNLDVSTGELESIEDFDLYSGAFSPDGTKLYTLEEGKIYQYNVDSENIKESKVSIGSIGENNRLFLAPDHKIYIFKRGVDYISGAIHCPNLSGLECGLAMTSLSLEGKSAGETFTNIPANFLFNDSITKCTLSTNENEINAINVTYKVYPNPANKSVTVDLNDPFLNAEISLIGTDGKKVLTKTILQKEIIDISKFSKGIYYVYIKTPSNLEVKKIVVQ